LTFRHHRTGIRPNLPPLPASPVIRNGERGAIYVACGAQYRSEAATSLASLRLSNPALPAMLLTDAPPEKPGDWDLVDIAPSLATLRNGSKLLMDRAPWPRCVFLDSDTLVVGDLGEGFAVLDRFEFAGHQAGGGHHYTLPGLPPSFPEVNSGVLFWRKGPRCDALFARWRELFALYNQDHEARTWDQKSLRMALWECDLRLAMLPANFNLMPYSPAVLERDLIVAHGRNVENLRRLHARLGRSTRMRAYVPGLGALTHPKDMPLSEILWTILRLLAWKLRGPRR
jgi:hypothetical protein